MRLLPAACVLALSIAALPCQGRGLWFEPMPEPDAFHCRAGAVTWRLQGGQMRARTPAGECTLALRGTSANATLTPVGRLGGVSHYHLGDDPGRWRTFVPHHASLRGEVLPGVTLVHRAAGADLEFDLVLAPGRNAADLRLRVDAAAPPRLLADGSVQVPLGEGTLRLQPPSVWQEHAGARRPVRCRYALHGMDLAFELDAFDPSLGLVIDPVVTFATALGGSLGQETVTGVGLDRTGHLIVTGTTQASDFPVQNGLPWSYRANIAWVARIGPNGNLVFATFFGGTSGNVVPVGLGADPNDQVVFGGNTTSPDLPTTAGVVQPTLMGGGDWFFAALQPGGQLAWCTYYGGPGLQTGMRALKVLDVQQGSVLGVGNEGTFPYMTNAYSQAGGMVVAGIRGGNQLWASSACGFSGTPYAVDVSAQGHICIAGTVSGTGSGLPTTGASFQPLPAGGLDGFVFVFTGQTSSLVFASHYGGSGNDIPRAIHAGIGPGTVVLTIAGDTTSTDLPLQNPIQATRGAVQDGFVARLDGLTQTLQFATYLGGADAGESFSRLGVDAGLATVVGGQSSASDLPLQNAMKRTHPASGRDVVLYRILPTGALDWCTALGGNGVEQLTALHVAPGGEIAVAGQVSTHYLPITANALMAPTVVSQDAFLFRIDPRSMPSYGTGTPGFGGFVPVLAGGGPDQIGTTALLQVHDGRAQTLGFLVAGFGRTSTPFFNGLLLTNPLSVQTVVLAGNTVPGQAAAGGGWFYQGVPIPNNTALRGLIVDWQAGFLDPAGSGGVSLTNAVELTVR